MKKVDASYILKQMLLRAILATVLGLAIEIAMCIAWDGPMLFGPTMTFIVICWVIVFIVYGLHMAWGGSDKAAGKTFDAGLEEHQFREVSTFSTSNAFLAIDGVDGRIAYVSNYNPKEFQIAQVKDVSRIESGMNKGPLGGATAVYFSFMYKNKKTKIFTFLTNSAYSLKSAEVIEAVSRADMYVDMLKKLQGAQNG